MSRIRVVIDRVVLQGFDPAEGNALIEGLRSELERTLADHQARAAWKSHRRPVLRLGGLSLRPGPSGSRSCGSQIARAVGRSMTP
jgi:hypothetical protein